AAAPAAHDRARPRVPRTAARRLPRSDRPARDRGPLLQGDRGGRRRAGRHGHVATRPSTRAAADDTEAKRAQGDSPMSCELVERDLDAYLDRELDAEGLAAGREHVTSGG